MADKRKFLIIECDDAFKEKVKEQAKSEYGLSTSAYIRMLIKKDMNKTKGEWF